MKLLKLGKASSNVEIQNVSKFGVWLFAAGKEFFLPFERHPWFKEATIGQISNVHLQFGHLLHWPDLDVDLAVDSLEHPERYPLVAKWPHPAHRGSRKKAA